MMLRLNYFAIAAVLGLVACDRTDRDPESTAPREAERPMAETTPEDRAETRPEMAHDTPKADEDTGDREAEAEFESAPNLKVAGDAELEETDNGGVEIEVEISGAPVGKKGLQIVRTASCDNVTKAGSGNTAPLGDDRLGDLGNITIEDDGEGELKITIPNANLDPGDAKSFIGKSIVLYEAEAKAGTNSGKPIACAPIKTS